MTTKFEGWRKSSYSPDTRPQCVEVGTAPGLVGVRDSTLPDDQPVISVPRTAWKTFLASVRA